MKSPLHYTILAILLLGHCIPPATALMASNVGALGDYSAAAAGLFNNMRTPAALIGGALVPIGILQAPTIEEGDSKGVKVLKKANIIIAVASLLSEILAVVYSSIAINKIAEIAQPQTLGVAQLISEKHELAWLGTNIHFLLGMMGFALAVGCKSIFSVGPSMGKVTLSWAIASFLQVLAVVNRGIAMGSEANDVSSRFASNFFFLILRYIKTAFNASKGGICGIGAAAAASYALFATVKILLETTKEDDTPAP